MKKIFFFVPLISIFILLLLIGIALLKQDNIFQNNKVMIIGIAYKDKETDVYDFLNNFGNPYKKIGSDANGETAINWGVYGVPETFLIDKDGIIILRHAGPITKDVMINEILPKLKEINL